MTATCDRFSLEFDPKLFIIVCILLRQHVWVDVAPVALSESWVCYSQRFRERGIESKSIDCSSFFSDYSINEQHEKAALECM